MNQYEVVNEEEEADEEEGEESGESEELHRTLQRGTKPYQYRQQHYPNSGKIPDRLVCSSPHGQKIPCGDIAGVP